MGTKHLRAEKRPIHKQGHISTNWICSIHLFLLILLVTSFAVSAGCIGMLKIANETGKKPVLTAEERTALLQQIVEENGDVSVPIPAATPVLVPVVPAPTRYALPDALQPGQDYIYGDHEHEMHATVYDVKVLPFYFWWFIDYNKFVVKQPAEGNQFLVVFLRFENHGTKSALVPSAEMLPVLYNNTIYMHNTYFDTSVLSSFQRDMYGGANENAKLPYQWIRELGQDKRDYAFLSGYRVIDTGSNLTTVNGSLANADVWSSITRCTGSISLPTDSGGKVTRDITDGQCPGFFIKPGENNAIDGYLIYEIPETLDLKKTYLYGFFNKYSWTRWRLG